MLRNNSTLESLTLSANDIKNEGGNTLIASLTQNTSLSSLLLAQVRLLLCDSGNRKKDLVLFNILKVHVIGQFSF